ncbi:hypothetical protein HZF02_11650 [Pseudomonas yamanorum]|nr:hypothetical protein HZF02_11650 [Pseudomonas yamanorum]
MFRILSTPNVVGGSSVAMAESGGFSNVEDSTLLAGAENKEDAASGSKSQKGAINSAGHKLTLSRRLHDHFLECKMGRHSHVTYRGMAKIEKSEPLMAENLKRGFDLAKAIIQDALQTLTEPSACLKVVEGYIGHGSECNIDTLRKKFLEVEKGVNFYANHPEKVVAVGGEGKASVSYNGCVLEPKEKANIYLNIRSVVDRDVETTASLILHEVSHAYANTSDFYYIKSEADYMWASMYKSGHVDEALLTQAQATAASDIDNKARAIVEGKVPSNYSVSSSGYGMSAADFKAYARMRRFQKDPEERTRAAMSNADTLAYLACALSRSRRDQPDRI